MLGEHIMSKINEVKTAVKDYFSHLAGENYVRVLDTPNVWGLNFDEGIMPRARERQQEFERAIVEIIQKTKYRCDLSSLNSPDPDWTRAILGAIDTALSASKKGDDPIQFRFLFGQTPLYPMTPPPNYTEFQAALIRLFRIRSSFWAVKPEIWIGRFYRLEKGIRSSMFAKITSPKFTDETKMTWNHSKIIAVDGCEALVGGHNLNMDLFRSYPPVHDVSVVIHGEAAQGAQDYLNKMWQCKTDLLSKETLDNDALTWKSADDDSASVRKPLDPLASGKGQDHMTLSQKAIVNLHKQGLVPLPDQKPAPIELKASAKLSLSESIKAIDLDTLEELKQDVFQERIIYRDYDKFSQYKLASNVLSVGKYWTGPKRDTDYQEASEHMKKTLIMGAKKCIRLSQMDLISAWKKNWSDHVVCHWIMDALIQNPHLNVQIVVSPLDAGAGAEGDQYSFGSGACRTFELIQHYMFTTPEGTPINDSQGTRRNAMARLHIAPLFFTDKVPKDKTTEGKTYKWPSLSPEGYTATLKQASLREKPVKKGGIIGSAAKSVAKASGSFYDKVESAPGNHAKIMIIDDEAYIVGSDNLYPGFLSEFNYLIEGKEAVEDLIENYWNKLWLYSAPHCTNPVCKNSSKPNH
ncbi:murine toxin [Marinomonas sp. MED121]|nr:murine toxin [Marinomonas sp. MED121]